MSLAVRVSGLSAALLLLYGCIAPMGAREARQIANTRLTKYCAGGCGSLTWSHTQKIKSRWLVDFEGQRQKFTVTVENDGNSRVTAWDKNVPAP